MVILVFLPLLFKGKNEYILYFSILAIIGFFIVKGPNPPLGEINLGLDVTNIPFLARLFRHNYEYFGVFIPLSYAVLIGNGLSCLFSISKFKQKIEGSHKQKKIFNKKILKILTAGVLFFLILGLYAWPFWTGNLIYQAGNVIPSARVNVPVYYSNAADWLKTQSGDFNILSMPLSQLDYGAFWWNNGTDGYYGADPTPWLLNKPVVISAQSGNGLSGEIATMITTNSSLNIGKLLMLLNVKYILFHGDSDWAYVENFSWWISAPPAQIQSYLSSQKDLSFKNEFGELSFYGNNDWRPMEIYAATNNILVNGNLTAMINVAEQNDFNASESVLMLSDQLNQRQIQNLPINGVFNQNSENLSINSFGQDQNNSTQITPNMVDQPSLISTKINPTKYTIQVNASAPYYLVFSESFDNGWVATINGQQVPSQYHFTANGYANGWYINKTGTYTVTLEFTPQNLFYAGAAISITTLIICTAYVSKNKIKKTYQKHIKKNKTPGT